VLVGAPSAQAVTLAALRADNTFFFVDSAAPGVITYAGTVTGIQAGETILGWDRRPATQSLFAVTSNSRVCEVDTNTGFCGNRGSFGGAQTGIWGVDFNPTVDRIRLVNDAELNLRAVPDTGALAGTDTALTPAGSAVAAAYTNNIVGGGVTTLFVIDNATGTLLRQGGPDGNPSPNGGVLTTIGPLGVTPTGNVAFEITDQGQAFAALTVGGTAGLYAINLATGAATLVGTLGTGTAVVGLGQGPAVGNAIPTLTRNTLLTLGSVLVLLGLFAVRRRSAA
jgi:hypothetical protein